MKIWYTSSRSILCYLLLPFSWLFYLIISCRRFLYQHHFKKPHYFPVPIIVVGNITVGGTGKTPFVIWLSDCLQKLGYRPGIVSRGAGGVKHTTPFWVQKDSSPHKVGDEAILLAAKTACPVVIAIDRVAAVKELLLKTDCNIVISDDGLQHYALARDIEIVLIDGNRQFGNQKLLPAGPLREPISRLKNVDWVIINGGHQASMQLSGDQLFLLNDLTQTKPLNYFKAQTVHAIAAIGNPERFFSSLQKAGLNIIPHAFPDHYLFKRDDIFFNDILPVIMTEKDAVKCRDFFVGANQATHWYLPVTAQIDAIIQEEIIQTCKTLKK